VDTSLESAADEAERLRRCLNDLVSIMALPALWAGREPTQIVSTLLDTLLGMLRLAFVFARVQDPDGGPPTELVRMAEASGGAAVARQISGSIHSLFGDAPPKWPSSARMVIGDVDLSVASARLGIDGEIGIIVTGSDRLNFPDENERLLLDVAANQAAVGLQEARLLSEQTRRANESERESRLIVDSIPGLVALLSPTGYVEMVNRSLLEYFGQTLEELREWGTNGTVHPEDLPHVVEVFTRSITSGTPYEIVQRLRRGDGIYRWIQNSGFPLRDTKGQIARWCVLLTDIDDRKRAETGLRQAYGHLAEAQRLSKTGSFITDLLADHRDWSEEAFRIFEFEPTTSITLQTIRGLVHSEDRPAYDAAYKRAIQGIGFDMAFRIITLAGNLKHLHAVGHVMEEIAGRPVFIGAIQDVTESKVAEEALNRVRSELTHVARVTTLSTLTASIAHEVNQPLSGIITNAGTCLRMLDANPPNIDGARETARRTIRDGNRASEVVTRLRALFSKKDFTPEPLDLNEATREVITLSLSELQRNRVIVQSELADDLPSISGDRVQLQQVVLNLLRNASDAMVAVHDRPRQLLIRTKREDPDRVRLTVRDAGIGFDRQTMDKLFDAFYTTKSDGMGIGLSISRSIIENHGGRLWGEPNDGPGATFSFSIPCCARSVADAESAVKTS
jgi:PAS domain S-box-containing protein